MLGIIAEKLGMTQIYNKEGQIVPVTVVKVLPNNVVGTKTNSKHGYNAVQLGYDEQKESRLNKPKLGYYKKIKQAPAKIVKEFKTDRSSEYNIGMKLSAASLAEGEIINVQGVSKGKGFQGVMKLYSFAGGCSSHGTSVAHRVPGSIGQGTDPGRVIKNSKLPRHMGDETVTIKNLEIVGIELDQNIVLIKGAIPGSKKSHLYLYPQTNEFEEKVLAQKESTEKNSESKENKNNKETEKKVEENNTKA
ncbi:50S ribosomal protein L3 [bacterium K02(2017)]|nr:50S ribosomal protein L3 [bacterium K02(2017)]